MSKVKIPEPNWRKPLGTLLILAIIALWAAIVVTASSLVEQQTQLVQAVYYIAAGIVWILPMKPLLRWMESGGDSRKDKTMDG